MLAFKPFAALKNSLIHPGRRCEFSLSRILPRAQLRKDLAPEPASLQLLRTRLG